MRDRRFHTDAGQPATAERTAPAGGPRTWREWAAELRRLGLPRDPHDTIASMRARIGTAARAAFASPLVVAVAPALTGSPEAITAVIAAAGQTPPTRLAPGVAMVPPGRMTALRRRLASVEGIALREQEHGFSYESNVHPAHAAAARLVQEVGAVLGWRGDLLPRELRLIPAPSDPGDRQQMEALLRAWLRSLGAALAPDGAETPSVPARPSRARVLAQARAAIAARASMRVLYKPAGLAPPLWREIEPLAIRNPRGRALIEAYCHLRADLRHFRAEGILAIDPRSQPRTAPIPPPNATHSTTC